MTIYITGSIILPDDRDEPDAGSQFSISLPDYGYQQWGATTERLGRSVDIIEAMVDGLKGGEVFTSELDDEDDLGFAHTQGD